MKDKFSQVEVPNKVNDAGQILTRAATIKKAGSIDAALADGELKEPFLCTLSEALILGLLKQGVKKYFAVFGHGSTQIGEVLRIYGKAGIASTYQFRNEVAMSHAATALSWIYGEIPALITSIGPGALQAMSGSLTAASNGIGVYHLYGDETTHGEGYNMQQIPKNSQNMYGNLTAVMGQSYTLHTPDALRDALRKGLTTVHHPYKAAPFYLMLPINTQPKMVLVNLKALPGLGQIPKQVLVNQEFYDRAVKLIRKTEKIIIKAGGGANKFADRVRELAELTGSTVVLCPKTTGILSDQHSQNMHVGGSKGSISGNYAMENSHLLIAIGSRSVCQSDCSGIGYPNVKAVININGDLDDALHYNNTIPFLGDIGAVLDGFIERIKKASLDLDNKKSWLDDCYKQKKKWLKFKQEKFKAGPQYDDVWKTKVLTQPQAIKTVVDFANNINALKLFDAGDVQANGFQIVEDDRCDQTITDSGASYMGFAVSALSSGAIADNPRFAIAFSGDGSFMMNPQILIDGIEHGVHAAIVIFDNRRMAAITNLQLAQYEAEFCTNDQVAVDYIKLAGAVKGIQALDGGTSMKTLYAALESAHQYIGLSVIHVPVYSGKNVVGSMGAYGSWNVGNWCEDVQKIYHRQNL